VTLTRRRRPRAQGGAIPELGSFRNALQGPRRSGALVSPNLGRVVRIPRVTDVLLGENVSRVEPRK
jgi:hypothetical protein